MNAFKAFTQQLALQADRKILETEEADYLRLDLSAHEKASWAVMDIKKATALSGIKRFALTALAIYLGLFTITNAQAYAKIALASINESVQEYEAKIPPVPAVSLSADPWTGERIAQHVEVEKPLEMLSYAPDPISGLNAKLSVPTSYENRITIPSLKINAPVVEPTLGLEALEAKDWSALEEQISETLLEGVVHYPGTAEPGQTGNAFLTGHSSNVFWQKSIFNTVFALLPKIQVGDDIFVTYDQIEYHYRVIEKKEVSPSEVSILKQTEGKFLSLVTCTPVGTTLKRLVVTAELVD